VPKGWKTEKGPAPWLADLGLVEHPSPQYPPRTRANVRDSDGTLLVGNPSSLGSKLTLNTAKRTGKPFYGIITEAGHDLSRHVVPFQKWLLDNHIRVLNVAGNRESKAPGITATVHDFLVEALS